MDLKKIGLPKKEPTTHLRKWAESWEWTGIIWNCTKKPTYSKIPLIRFPRKHKKDCVILVTYHALNKENLYIWLQNSGKKCPTHVFLVSLYQFISVSDSVQKLKNWKNKLFLTRFYTSMSTLKLRVSSSKLPCMLSSDLFPVCNMPTPNIDSLKNFAKRETTLQMESFSLRESVFSSWRFLLPEYHSKLQTRHMLRVAKTRQNTKGNGGASPSL